MSGDLVPGDVPTRILYFAVCTDRGWSRYEDPTFGGAFEWKQKNNSDEEPLHVESRWNVAGKQ